ncbi:response regulator [Streptomyces gamaensis]|uniref:Response regulator n=1 Tax=Streptomyces gamaensis TaxID=1763542 RepID=A0ABW0ZB21_9ACTN
MTTRVLVVDDQELVRAGLVAVLDSAPGISVVGQAKDGTEAVRRASELAPDVVILDVRMPEMDGIQAAEHIMAAHPDIRVVILTTFDLDEYVFRALRAGVTGFILKDAGAEGFVRAVETVARGDSLLSPTVTRRVIEEYASLTVGRPRPSEHLTKATPRELEVMTLVARGHDNASIARQLGISAGTVKVHLHRIMAKYGLASRAQVVILGYEAGLVSPGRCRPVTTPCPTGPSPTTPAQPHPGTSAGHHD